MRSTLLRPYWLILGLGLSLSTATAVEITVAPGGLNSGPGTNDRPLGSPLVAQQLARAAIKAGERQVRVLLRPGTYHLREPLVLGPEDIPVGGDALWEGDEAVLSGGVPLRGWEAGEPGLWTCRLPLEVPQHSGLYAGLVPCPPSVWGPVTISAIGPRITLAQPAPAGITGELVVVHAWGTCRAAALSTGGTLDYQSGLAWPPVPELAPHVGSPVFIEGLTRPAPGQWRLISGSRIEYASADQPVEGKLVCPVLPCVLQIAGRPDAPVRRLTLRGIGVAHGAWPRPAAGVAGIQAGHIATAGREPQVAALPAAVQVTWADGVLLERVTVQGSDGSGIALGAGCRDVRLVRCTVADAGGCGIVVGWRGPTIATLSADWADSDEIPLRNLIQRCLVTRCARLDWGSVGIAVLFSAKTQITGNQIEDLPYSGISLGFRWDTSLTSQKATLVEGNRIRRVMRRLCDGGAIYTLGWQPAARISDNLIEDIGGELLAKGGEQQGKGGEPQAKSSEPLVNGAPVGGMFFDNGSKGILVENNVLVRINGEPLRFNGCAPSWLLLGTNTVVTTGPTPVPPAVAEGTGP